MAINWYQSVETRVKPPLYKTRLTVLARIKRTTPWAGLEPAAYGLEIRCSIQLSYQGIHYGQSLRKRIANNSSCIMQLGRIIPPRFAKITRPPRTCLNARHIQPILTINHHRLRGNKPVNTAQYIIKPTSETDLLDWVLDQMRCTWGADIMVTRGVLHHLSNLTGFVALDPDTKDKIGWIMYHINQPTANDTTTPTRSCEIIVVHTLQREVGVGSALVDRVIQEVTSRKCKDVWLITTNDNIEAIRFWQKRGFAINAIHTNAMEHSRKLKPSIPLIGKHGIPIRDEIEFRLIQ